ncbi:MAG: anhydro-N-acetylmuramic acid kinase [Magnetococcales bacterium]|nr:anhydro-N-acetylmuramic acid kinase [Magnetococcales bacterium]
MERSLLAIGLISGTSADGIDAVVVRTDGVGTPELLAAQENPYPPEVRQEVLALYQPGPNEIDRMGRMDNRLGELFAKAALTVCQKAGLSPDQVDVIGSHGQTIRHRPPDFTLQIADPAIIAARTGIQTVADFRRADMARGGEGAPLVPLFHRAIFQAESEDLAILNLGGIANLTWLSQEATSLVAGDTGPANTLMDHLVCRIQGEEGSCHLYDDQGAGAAEGVVDQQALSWLLTHPYLARPFPKSTGREVFGDDYLDRFLSRFPHLINQDGLATLTRFTAETIAAACRTLASQTPYRLVVCGGGGKNRTLLQMIEEILPAVSVVSSHALGIDSDSLESQCFAWMAVRTLKGLPSSDPGATGASQEAILGGVHPVLPNGELD